MKTRKTVQKHLVRQNSMGPVYFIKITFTDDTYTYGVSDPLGMHLFGPQGRERAWNEAHSQITHGDAGFYELMGKYKS